MYRHVKGAPEFLGFQSFACIGPGVLPLGIPSCPISYSSILCSPLYAVFSFRSRLSSP
jgi:hypothetical protein